VAQKNKSKPKYMLLFYKSMEEIPKSKNANQGLLFQKYWQWNRVNDEWDNNAWLKDKWDGTTVGDPVLLQDYRNRLTKLSGPQSVFLCVKNTERLIIGMGLPHALENGLSWHPTLGVPFVPGSSLKGMVRNWARLEKIDSTTITRIFGNEEEAEEQVGSIIFMDMIPFKPIKLEQDIMTPHFQEYYSDPNNPPHDRYNPIPISFLTLAKGQSFMIALTLRKSGAQADMNKVVKWIWEALRWEGLGAKTAVGYGRFKQDEGKEREVQEQKLAMQKEAEEQQRRAELAQLPPIIREMKENGYDDDLEQFMRTMGDWLDQMEAADTTYEDQIKIANLLQQWYNLHRPDQWTKPNKKNKEKIRRIKVILGKQF
jgi:CRISPR-associated protein Cmr6